MQNKEFPQVHFKGVVELTPINSPLTSCGYLADYQDSVKTRDKNNLLHKLRELEKEFNSKKLPDTLWWDDEAYCHNCSTHYDDGFSNGYDQGKYDLVKELLNDLRGI